MAQLSTAHSCNTITQFPELILSLHSRPSFSRLPIIFLLTIMILCLKTFQWMHAFHRTKSKLPGIAHRPLQTLTSSNLSNFLSPSAICSLDAEFLMTPWPTKFSAMTLELFSSLFLKDASPSNEFKQIRNFCVKLSLTTPDRVNFISRNVFSLFFFSLLIDLGPYPYYLLS